MALLHVNFFSQVIGMASSVNVILPEKIQGIGVTEDNNNHETPAKVLYLLHGYSDDHTIWQRRTSIERYVTGKNVAVIMPCVGTSFYSNEKVGFRYWDYISEELPEIMSSFFKISTKREDTFVAGLSMGGFGTMKLALNQPERFAAAASLSGALDMEKMYSRLHMTPSMGFIEKVGTYDEIKGGQNDLFHMAQYTKEHAEALPRLFIACGTEDFLYDDHQKFCPYIEELGYDLKRVDTKGESHEWSYWDKMIQEALHFFGI